MLAASWALVRTPWSSLGRLYFRWHHVSRPLYQDAWITTLPHARSEETDSLFEPKTQEYAIISRESLGRQNPQTSAQALAKLVKEGKYAIADKIRAELLDLGVKVEPDRIYEGPVKAMLQWPNAQNHVNPFIDWLKLLPDAHDPIPAEFGGILELLLASPQTTLRLITAFGVTCASKGYAEIVRSKIVPVVERFADPTTSLQFFRDLKAETARYQDWLVAQSLTASVFEDPSHDEDYAQVASASKPVPPSISSLIRQTLPNLLPAPSNDALIFEDESLSDYISYTPTSDVHTSYSLTEALPQLVADGHYQEAYRILTELHEINADISSSWVYEEAAIASLRPLSSALHLPTRDQVAQFTSWLSLIPPAHLSKPRRFTELRRLIFHAPLTNMLIVIRFALTLCSKGYGDIVGKDVIPLVARFNPPEVSQQFLDDFEKADGDYWTEHSPEDVLYRAKRTATIVRGLAIRSLAYSGRLEEAMKFLPDPDALSFRLSSYTYDVLLRRLRNSPDSSFDHLKLVQRLRADAVTSLTGICEVYEKKEDSLTSSMEELQLVADIGASPPKDFGDDLAGSLRYLKHMLPRDNNLPHPFTILDFTTRYLSTGRTRAVAMLRNRALRSSPRSAALFLFAEMLHYHRTDTPDLIIQTFVDHFYMTGIPREDVFMLYQRKQRQQAEEMAGFSEESPSRIYHHSNPMVSPGIRLWPSIVHCNLIWHALVRLTPTDQGMDLLYQKLLELARTGKMRRESPSVAEINPLIPPPSWKHNVGSGAFTPFMRRLMHGFGASRGATILADMLRVGIEPTVYHFTELAGFYARYGDVARSFLILDKMEANFPPKKEVPQVDPSRSDSVSGASAGGDGDQRLAENSAPDTSSSGTSVGTTGPTYAAAPAAKEGPWVTEGTETGQALSSDTGSTPTTVQSISPSSPPRPTAGFYFPPPDRVMYISLMRGFLIFRSLEGAEETLRRFLKRHEYIPGQDTYLDDALADTEKLREDYTREHKATNAWHAIAQNKDSTP